MPLLKNAGRLPQRIIKKEKLKRKNEKVEKGTGQQARFYFFILDFDFKDGKKIIIRESTCRRHQGL
jgi:hypothetical protein